MSSIGRAAASALRACGGFFFRYRNAAFPLVLLALFVAFPPAWSGGSKAIDRWVDAGGLMLALSGQALRAAVIGFAYIKRGGLNKRVHAETLVTEGFFGVCRNPLYLGNFLTLSGLFVIHGNPWALVLGLAFFLFAYVSIVAAEEAFLRGKFGADYETYCRRVNRWWPNPGRLAEATRGMTFNWRRVVIKDYSTACAWLAGAAALLAYEGVWNEGIAAAQPRLVALAVLLVLLAAALCAVRYAKKSGRLTERPAA